MKTTLISILIIFIFFSICRSQNNIAFFQIEKENFVQFENFVEGTTLEYFNKSTGGKQIGKMTIGNEKEKSEIFDIEHTPAFILNRKGPDNVNGSNRVYLLKNKEFIARDIKFQITSNEIFINWNAHIAQGKNIEFRILKREGTGNYHIIKTLSGIAGNNFIDYNFSEPYKNGTSYQLEIIQDKEMIRYTSKQTGKPDFIDPIQVYPTVFSGNINIILNDTKDYANQYKVCDMTGKIVQNGELNANVNIIDLHGLTKGNYIIIVTGKELNQSFKICKV